MQRRRAAGDPAATLAFDVYCRRIREYVGAYLAVLGRVDAITFTAGVGENAADVRAASLSGLAALGIEVDDDRNAAGERIISPDGSRVAVCVVPTDEELEIAGQSPHGARAGLEDQPDDQGDHDHGEDDPPMISGVLMRSPAPAGCS